MAWQDIIGHEKTKEILQNSVLSGKFSGAYLISGIAGIGKDALAIEFAKTAMCENPQINGNYIEACTKCKSCKNMAHLAHVNFEFITSLPTGTTSDTKNDDPLDKLANTVIEEIKEQIAEKAHNPYHKINISGANQIRISQIRHLKKKLSMTTNSEGPRFVIISNAENMAQEAANAFLKTLEEPSPNTTLILTSSRADTILPTIHSRCRHINCNPISDELIISELIKRENIDEVNARIAATFAQGSYSKALETLSEDTNELRVIALEMLRNSLIKGIYRDKLLENIERFEKRDKNDINIILHFLMFWMRDCIVLKNNISSDSLINIDRIETIKKFIEVFPNAEIQEAIKVLEETVRLIERNVNVKLSLITLFIKFRRIFLERED